MWLEISEDLAIDADSIISVESIGQMNCAIYTESRVYNVAMPKSVVMSMIDARKKGNNSMSNVEKLLTQIYQGQVTPRP